MTTDTPVKLTLKQLREDKKWSAEKVAGMIQALLGRQSYHFSSVLKAESQGTRQADVIRAMASIYEQPMDLIMELTKPVKNK